jgi:hypothetical protein
MTRAFGLRGVGLAGVSLAIAFLTLVGPATASGGTKVCVPSKEGKQIVTPKAGLCKAGYTLTELGAEGKEGKQGPEGKSEFTAEEIALLKSVLPHVKYLASGVGAKPTIQFSGVNVQVISGSGSTNAAVNGEGNLVIGYDENAEAHEQTGSHNLILGEEQTFTSYGGFLGGFKNADTAPFASASGGFSNTASGELSSVGGGEFNTASAGEASVSGGVSNTASGGGAAVSGGVNNTAKGSVSSVSGGYKNTAEGIRSSIFGGKELTSSTEYEAIP